MSSSTDRVREHRRRQRSGVMQVVLEIDEDTISILVDAGLLAVLDQEDSDKVGAALDRLIELATTVDLRGS